MQHISHMYRVLDSQLHDDLRTKPFLSDNTVATFESTSASPATRSLHRQQRFIGASRSVHDRDFPLGARWGGWCKSERATLRRGHHSSFHLSPPGGRTAVTCSMWMERTAGRKHSTGVKHRTNKALEVHLGLVSQKHAFLP